MFEFLYHSDKKRFIMETKLEYILTNSYKAEMISYMDTHPQDFEELINLAISDKQLYSWRAAWLLWSCMEKNDQRLHRHIDKIIEILPAKNDDQLRELLIILQQMELTGENEGKLFDTCVNIWEKIGKKPSVRYNAFKLIIKIVKKHPELIKEIELLTESQYMDSFSATVKKSIIKLKSSLS